MDRPDTKGDQMSGQFAQAQQAKQDPQPLRVVIANHDSVVR
jgi:hypothetical protein